MLLVLSTGRRPGSARWMRRPGLPCFPAPLYGLHATSTLGLRTRGLTSRSYQGRQELGKSTRPDVEWTTVLGRATARRLLAQEANMTFIWVGVLLVFGGVLQMAFQPIWRGRLSRGRPLASQRRTLEPERPGSGFAIKSNWPGLVLVALGGAFLLAGAAI
jgi:hypothetical protein